MGVMVGIGVANKVRRRLESSESGRDISINYDMGLACSGHVIKTSYITNTIYDGWVAGDGGNEWRTEGADV